MLSSRQIICIVCFFCAATFFALASGMRAHEDTNALSPGLLDSLFSESGFTEPIETIKVATAEMGIVNKIHVKPGDHVEAGDLLVELDTRVIEATRKVAESKANSKARQKAAQIEYEIKRKRYEKFVELARDGAGSPEEVERSRADAEVALQNVEAILEESEQFRLEVEQYTAQKERRRTRSPIYGEVIDVRKRVGEFVSTNEPHVVTVVQLDTLKATFHISTSRAIELENGDEVEVYFAETDQLAQAKVEFVAPVTQADSGRVRVDVLIENQGGDYRSGVSCELRGKTEKQASLKNMLRKK